MSLRDLDNRLIDIITDKNFLTSIGIPAKNVDILKSYLPENKTLQNTAEEYNLTGERVRQIIAKVLHDLEKYLYELSKYGNPRELEHEVKRLKREKHNLQISFGIKSDSNPEEVNGRIEDLNVGARCYNVLRGPMGIEYIYELDGMSRSDFLRQINFGQKSLKELEDALWEYNIRLK